MLKEMVDLSLHLATKRGSFPHQDTQCLIKNTPLQEDVPKVWYTMDQTKLQSSTSIETNKTYQPTAGI